MPEAVRKAYDFLTNGRASDSGSQELLIFYYERLQRLTFWSDFQSVRWADTGTIDIRYVAHAYAIEIEWLSLLPPLANDPVKIQENLRNCENMLEYWNGRSQARLSKEGIRPEDYEELVTALDQLMLSLGWAGDTAKTPRVFGVGDYGQAMEVWPCRL